MNLERTLTIDEAAFLTGFPPNAIREMGKENGRLFLPELVDGDRLTLSQVFGLNFIASMRRTKGWNRTCALTAGRWLGEQSAAELNWQLACGSRFALAVQDRDVDSLGSELEQVRLLLDENQVQNVIAEVMGLAVENDMYVSFVDVATGWEGFKELVEDMYSDDGLPRPSLN